MTANVRLYIHTFTLFHTLHNARYSLRRMLSAIFGEAAHPPPVSPLACCHGARCHPPARQDRRAPALQPPLMAFSTWSCAGRVTALLSAGGRSGAPPCRREVTGRQRAPVTPRPPRPGPAGSSISVGASAARPRGCEPA